MHLPEDHLPLPALLRPPGTDTPLERAPHAIGRFGVTAAQLLEHGHRSDLRGSLQHRYDLGVKDLGQQIWPPPASRDLLLGRQPAVVLDPVCARHTDRCLRRGHCHRLGESVLHVERQLVIVDVSAGHEAGPPRECPVLNTRSATITGSPTPPEADRPGGELLGLRPRTSPPEQFSHPDCRAAFILIDVPQHVSVRHSRCDRSDPLSRGNRPEEIGKIRYRNIFTRAERELPPIPARQSGKRGRVAKSDAHNLSERLKEHETAVLLFARNPHVAFTNNRAERDLRMSKVRQKVSGCFRKAEFAQAYCRICSYLQTMASQGCNRLVAIQMALSGQLCAKTE